MTAWADTSQPGPYTLIERVGAGGIGLHRTLLRILGDDGAGREPAGWYCYRGIRGETVSAAARLERARFFGRQFTSTPYWPPFARRMNLPEAS